MLGFNLIRRFANNKAFLKLIKLKAQTIESFIYNELKILHFASIANNNSKTRRRTTHKLNVCYQNYKWISTFMPEYIFYKYTYFLKWLKHCKNKAHFLIHNSVISISVLKKSTFAEINPKTNNTSFSAIKKNYNTSLNFKSYLGHICGVALIQILIFSALFHCTRSCPQITNTALAPEIQNKSQINKIHPFIVGYLYW